MISKGPAIPAVAVSAVLGLVIGGIAGYYGRASQEGSAGVGRVQSAPTGGTGAMMGGRGGGGMGGGGMGGGRGGQQPSASRDLTSLVRNLDTVEKVQSKGLTTEQKKSLAPILEKIKSASELNDDECKVQIAGIEGVLTGDQKAALAAMQPPRGGAGGRGGGGGGRMGGGGGMGGSGGMMGGGGGGRGGIGGADANKPFANDRNKQALDDLITAVGK